MNRRWYENAIYNPGLDWLLDRHAIHEERRRTLASAKGAILDVGTGTGLNFPNYPAQVCTLKSVTLEPTLDRRARHRAGARGLHVAHVQGNAQALPFDDEEFDTVVATFLLCSVPDPSAAVREFARVLKPDGRLLFLEHVLAPRQPRRALQRLAEPFVRLFAEGCSLVRDSARTIAENGFVVELHESELRGMPWIARHVARGIGSKAAVSARPAEPSSMESSCLSSAADRGTVLPSF